MNTHLTRTIGLATILFLATALVPSAAANHLDCPPVNHLLCSEGEHSFAVEEGPDFAGIDVQAADALVWIICPEDIEPGVTKVPRACKEFVIEVGGLGLSATCEKSPTNGMDCMEAYSPMVGILVLATTSAMDVQDDNGDCETEMSRDGSERRVACETELELTDYAAVSLVCERREPVDSAGVAGEPTAAGCSVRYQLDI